MKRSIKTEEITLCFVISWSEFFQQTLNYIECVIKNYIMNTLNDGGN